MAKEYTKIASFKRETASPQNEDVLNDNDGSVTNGNSLSGPPRDQNSEQELQQTSTTVSGGYSKGRLSIA